VDRLDREVEPYRAAVAVERERAQRPDVEHGLPAPGGVEGHRDVRGTDRGLHGRADGEAEPAAEHRGDDDGDDPGGAATHEPPGEVLEPQDPHLPSYY